MAFSHSGILSGCGAAPCRPLIYRLHTNTSSLMMRACFNGARSAGGDIQRFDGNDMRQVLGRPDPNYTAARSNIIGLHGLPSALEGGAELLMDGRSEVLLPHGLDAALLPRHVALIMDGNNRWARRKGLAAEQGYEAGADTWQHIVHLSARWGLSALTAFFFSTENWLRPQAEVEALLQLFERLMHRVRDDFVRCNVQARAVGDTSQLPPSLQTALDKLEQSTAQNDGLKVSIAMNYGGRYDLVQACRGIAADARDGKLLPCDVSEDLIEGKLLTRWMGADTQHPDLVIRTSGDKRISNFLLWQTAYAELLFLDFFWPEMDEFRYAQALMAYQGRKRSFGRRTS
ncbi:hypothetical protein L7F22_064289 [Adiantum nelumboides]|nr:hypothetical protein [Adiantum nelumboides]